jgi:hypothetical protein
MLVVGKYVYYVYPTNNTGGHMHVPMFTRTIHVLLVGVDKCNKLEPTLDRY